MSEQLTISPIFTGLTRPAMMMGVTLEYMSICAMAALCCFIMGDSPLYLSVYLPLHVFGWVLCKIDPNIFRILMKRADCVYAPNKKIWGCQSYEPF